MLVGLVLVASWLGLRALDRWASAPDPVRGVLSSAGPSTAASATLTAPPSITPSAPMTAPPAERDGPFPPSAAAAKSELESLTVARNRDSERYQRDAFGPGWSGEGRHPKIEGGCEARDEVLRRDLAGVRAGDRNRCVIFEGTLTDPYTGAARPYSRYAPSQIEIDHIVALGAAWRSGASRWPFDQRVRFANDIDNMLAVDKRANQDKSSKAPDQWRPRQAYWCGYATRWVGIKKRYGLTVTDPERAALREMFAACPAG